MALSRWSKELFLRINHTVGKNKQLDQLMVFAADNLVYILVLCSLLWATTALEAQGGHLLNQYLKLLMTAFAFGIGLSWLTGWLLPNPRPIERFKRVRQLLEPYSTWKSFPSDHTIGSFTVATVTLLMGAPVWLIILLYFMAAAIAAGRVYVGVHEPRDIIGGFVIAMVFSLASPTLLAYITEPIYDIVMQLFV